MSAIMPGENFCLAMSLFPPCCSAPPLYQRLFIPHLPLLSCLSSLCYLSIKISEISKTSYLCSCANLSHFYGEFLESSLVGSKCLSSNEKPQGAATSASWFSGFAPEGEELRSTSPEKSGSMILGRTYINTGQTISL